MLMKPPAHRIRPISQGTPFLLIADVDGTLLGDEDGELALKTFRLEYPASCILAAVTGRTLSSVESLVLAGRLPRPEYIGSAVGTELMACNDEKNALGGKYAAQASKEWKLEEIYAAGEGKGVARQEFPEGQPLYQAGFRWNGEQEALAAFRDRLSGQKCHILASSGQYIDVLPDGLGKGELARFLQGELGIETDRVVVAGDSGNDCEMFETAFKGIVPSNALDELKSMARQCRHYHSPYPAARGVIDGLCRFGFVERCLG